MVSINSPLIQFDLTELSGYTNAATVDIPIAPESRRFSSGAELAEWLLSEDDLG